MHRRRSERVLREWLIVVIAEHVGTVNDFNRVDDDVVLSTTTTLDPNHDFRALALARGGSIGLSDVPAGWKLQSRYARGGGPSADVSIENAYAACLHVPAHVVITDFLPHAYEVLSDSSGGGVMSTVTIFPSVASARASFAAAVAPLAPSCKAAEMRAVFLTKGYGEIVTGAFVPTGLAGHTTMIRETVRASSTSSTTHEDFLVAELGSAFVYMDIEAPSLATSFELGLLQKSLEVDGCDRRELNIASSLLEPRR